MTTKTESASSKASLNASSTDAELNERIAELQAEQIAARGTAKNGTGKEAKSIRGPYRITAENEHRAGEIIKLRRLRYRRERRGSR